MRMYFAGSIRGGRKDVLRYASIIKILKKYGQVLTEHIGHQKVSKFGEKGIKENKIFKRDMQWLKKSDVLIAEVSTPSLGVGYEISTAIFLKMPIICLYREAKDAKLSTMIVGNTKLIIKKYKTIEEVEKILDIFFRKIKR
jgi:2'-deoxynucleoside 5'-phosphate N-hydrolase